MATATRVQDIYNTVCNVLLEPYNDGAAPGLSLGIVTKEQFLDLFGVVIQNWVQGTGISMVIFTQQINATQPDYLIPDDIVQLQNCFVGGKFVDRETLDSLDNFQHNWRGKSGTPRMWHEDGLPVKSIELVPVPSATGSNTYPFITTKLTDPPLYGVYGTFDAKAGNLTMVGTQGLSTSTFALADVIPVVPDSYCFYLAYGVLSKIFSTDGEAKDEQRAIYCGARYQEGLNLAAAVSGLLVGN